MERNLKNCLVTGATGFLGGALVRRLNAEGASVLALGRNQAVGATLGCSFESIDLSNADALVGAFRGANTVFHCAALSAPWGRKVDFWKANHLGTANVLHACKMAGVERLIHVSTPSIYFRHGDGLQVREDASLPRPVNEYAASKRAAESLVRAAEIPFVMLRPRALFGPGDQTILPKLVRAMQAGRLKQIGDGQNLTDLTYIDNAVDALLLAAQANSGYERNVYNITNGEPLPLWDLVRTLGELLGLNLRAGSISKPIAMGVAGLMELVYRCFSISREPLLTRYAVGVLAASQTLDITAAQRDLGYAPRITVREGLRRFAEAWQKEER
jgi:2-alkyl-3-oxoalkanoate reductase